MTNSNEEIIYEVEQALLPSEMRDCPECKGQGCEYCFHDGDYTGYLDKSLFGARFIGPTLPLGYVEEVL